MGRWKFFAVGIFALALVSGAGYFGYFGLPGKGTGQPQPQATPPPTVAVTRGDVRQIVSAPGQLVGTQQQDLNTGVAGRIDEVNVRPGDTVQKGQPLAQLGEKSKFEAAVSSANLELLQARQELDDLQANAPKAAADAHAALIKAEDDYNKAKQLVEALKYPRASQQRIDSAYNDYQKALEQVAVAQENYRSNLKYAQDDPRYVQALDMLTQITKEKDRLSAVYNWITAKPTEQEVAESQAALEQAKAVYDSAQRTWERLKDGPDAMALEIAQAKVAEKERLFAQAQADLQHLSLLAPFDGVIMDVKVKPGEEVTPNAVVMTLSNPGALEALVTVVEEDYSLMQTGLPAELYFDAQPETTTSGRVARIVPSRTNDTQPTYPVYIEIDQIPNGLAPGMTVDAAISTAEKKDVLMLPKALVRARSDGTATVQVWADGKKESREITIGLIGDSNVEIVSGLQEGELVVGQ